MRCRLFEADIDKWLKVNFGILGEWDDLPPIGADRTESEGPKK